MNNELAAATQKQINAELYSAYLYLSMSSWANHEGWKGIATWLHVQAQEEQVHALTLHSHLLERGQRSTFTAIETPPAEWDSPLTLFHNVFGHEETVTQGINNLATLAMQNHDHAFYQFIQMFIKEQVEEEATATEIIQRLKRLQDNPSMLDAFDKEMGTRVFVNPFPVQV